jgi:hypothetical protein
MAADRDLFSALQPRPSALKAFQQRGVRAQIPPPVEISEPLADVFHCIHDAVELELQAPLQAEYPLA